MKDIHYIVLLGIVLICGCCGTRAMDVHIQGNNIKSVYGSGDGDIHYISTTTWGKCNATNTVK